MGIGLKTAKSWVMMKMNITIAMHRVRSSLISWIEYQGYLFSILIDIFSDFEQKIKVNR